jgi:uncharacterized protein YfaS (alpha-2-macroglobulin family)
VRVDPVVFSADPRKAITNGVLVQTRNPTAGPTGGPSYNYGSSATFDNLAAGLYAVTATVAGKVRAWDVVQVTRVGAVQRSGTTQDLLWTVTLADGQPLSGVKVYRNGTQVATSGADGLAWIAHVDSIVALVSDKGVAAIAGQFGFGNNAARRVAVYTDRPLYRPGQTVHMKFVAWMRTADGFAPGPSETLLVQISTYTKGRQSNLESQSVAPNAYGSAVLDLVLAPDAALGSYMVQTTWAGETYYGSFEVQEYRLPKFRVDVSPNEKRVALGDAVPMLVSASHYYGEPLTDGKVHYDINGYNWGWSPCAWCSPEHVGGGETYHASGDLDLAPDGTARINVNPDRPGTYRIAVSVTAPTGEQVQASATLQVEPADRLIGLALDDWVVKPNETSHLRIRLSDLQEKPVTGPVHLVLTRQDWGYHNGQWDSQKSHVGSWTLQTQDGRADLAFKVPSSASYVFEASATDGQSRTTQTSLWLWASGDDWGWWHGGNLEMIPESTHVRVGDPIRVHVGAPRPQPVLVTLEGGDVLDARVLRGADRTASFLAQARHTPNVVATATQVTPQDGNPNYPSLPTAQVDIEVLPNTHGLQVAVDADRESYADGATARLLIKVRDADGRPVRAEVSLAMVDEALLSLRPDFSTTLLQTFYPQRSAGYPTGSWYNQYWDSGIGGGGGRPGFAAAASGATTATNAPEAHAALADKSSTPPADIKVREYFPETALWLPRLQTDTNGTVRLQAILPDSLTTWRISVQAITQKGDTGSNNTNLLTRRNVVADLFAPRFVTQGDETTVQATVANYVGALRDFQTLLNASGAQILGPDARTLSLSHGQSDLVSFRIKAPQVGVVNLTFYAWSGGTQAGDAIRIKVPVRPHGIESREGRAGRGSASVSLTIPPSATSGASHLNVSLSPTVSDALVDALPYLTGFPYGCVEQTLSRFLPTLAVAQAATTLGLNKSKIDPQIDEEVRAGLVRLYGFQHDDGAWGWWQTDGTNPYTTTYVVYGLAVARDAGYDVNATALRRGVDALVALAPGLKQTSPTLYAYALFALSVADKTKVSDVPSGSTATQLALSALVAQRIGQTSIAQQKAAQLARLSAEADGRRHWTDDAQGWGDHGISSDTIVTALALRALLRTGSNDSVANGAARWLLENRIGDHWYSTKDTAEAILSLVDYFRLDAAQTGPFNVDGASEILHIDPGRLFHASQSRDLVVAPGTHSISIRSDNQRLYWSAAATYWDGAEPIRATNSEFSVQRSMLDDKGRPVTSLRVGQEARVKLDIVAQGKGRHYVQIESPLPAGTEVVQEQAGDYFPGWYGDGMGRGMICQWCGSWSAAEVHDDRVAFFAWEMPVDQSFAFEYKVRAVFPGDYHVMPAQAQEMYDPAVRGHGDELRLRIDAVPGAQFGRVEVGADAVRANVYPVGDVGDHLSVYVKVGDQERSRRDFDRRGADHWTIELPTPAATQFWIVAEAGGSTSKKFVNLVPEAPPAPRAFNASQEHAWGTGSVLRVRSALAVEKAAPDYARVFVAHPPDAFKETSKRKKTDAPGLVFVVAAALAGLVALRRRRQD